MEAGRRWIDEHTPELVALADEIWSYAEVSLREERSAKAQAAFLEKEGFAVEKGVAHVPTAIVASYGQGKPIIGFLGEYDALPGISQKQKPTKDPVQEGGPGHGCGHNLLGVASLAAAIALKREIEAGRAQGTVRYYGCPAEETVIGKVWMARAGLYDDLDAAITWHPGVFNSVTYGRSLALNSVRFAFHGRTAHAAASPQMGISALDAVELMNVGVNFLREHVIQEARIHYVITKGGGQPNVVPPLAEVWYFIRAPRRPQVEEIYARIVKIAEGAALMTGARLEIKFQTGVYDYLPNGPLSELGEECLRQVGAPVFSEEEKTFAREIEKSFVPGQKESLLASMHVPREYWDTLLHEEVIAPFDVDKAMYGSTDVGDVSWIVPTVQLSTATWVCGSSGHSWQNTALSGMSIGHKGMITAAQAMARCGYEMMTRPELREKARAAFLKDTGGKPYLSPLPADLIDPQPQVA